MMEGLGLGILMGPIGPILVALLPDLRKAAEAEEHHVHHEVEPEVHAVTSHVESPAPQAAESVAYAAHPTPAPRVIVSPPAIRRETGDDWEAADAEAAIDRLEREDDLWDRGVPRIEKKLKIDWLWLAFYGGWSLFVVFCWLWLLMYV